MPRAAEKDFPGPAVPVLMYHSVGRTIPGWKWPDLTVPADVFEDHLRWLSRAGYRSAGLPELYAHTMGEKILPPRTIVLTFDDGYVDNWTYAAPLMERYGFSGTVLVTPEFVEPGDAVRPTLKTAGGEASQLEVRGFMTWEELRAGVAAGTLSVQSHAMTHTWYPVSDRVVDFHRPGDGYYWLDWNARPDRKPFYLLDPDESVVPPGTPVYENAKSLSAARYFPDPEEADALAGHVERRGAETFFSRPDWRDELYGVLERWRSGRKTTGRHETAEERLERTRHELVESKRRIEENVGVNVDFFVWPGGGYDEMSMNAALEVYRAVTIRSKGRMHWRNRPLESPGRIVRRGIPGALKDGQLVFYGGRYMLEFVKEFEGSVLARKRRQLLKLGHAAALVAGLWPKKNS